MKAAVIFAAVLMLLLPFWGGIEAEEKKAVAVITFYGIDGTKEIRREVEIEKAVGLIEEAKEGKFRATLSWLNDLNIKLGSNISNFMCFVFGAAKGVALYSLDLFFLLVGLAITGNPLGAIIFVAIIAAITHLLPFRIAQPVMLVGVENGNIVTIGVRGVQNIGSDESALLFGFVGVVINFFLPTEAEIFPLIIAGYALAVLPNPFA